MKSKLFIYLVALIISFSLCAKDSSFIRVEANKTLALFAFVETANNARSASQTLKEYIDDELKDSKEFQDLIKRYSEINLNYQLNYEEYPSARHTYRNTKDFIWIASSNATSVEDLSERILGYLPYENHIELIAVLNKIEPMYDNLIWNKKLKSIKKIKKKLSKYAGSIENIFLKINHFFGSSWNKSTPFKIMLYPIPAKQGHTTAIPKGNALIIGFLTEKEDDYLDRLGVIIHEMVHILYDAQPVEMQKDIDTWFNNSTSEHSKLAYNYINEGLATAIGNGWAYQQLNGVIDKEDWYNNPYINGFAHKMFDSVSLYLNSGKTIDEDFIENSTNLFAQAFPQAINQVEILMSENYLYANSTNKKNTDLIRNTLHKYFNIRSQWYYSSMKDKDAIESMHTTKTSKVFIVENNHKAIFALLKDQFPTFLNTLNHKENFIYTFKDEISNSTVFIVNIQNLNKLNQAIKQLAKEKIIKLGLQKIN